MDSISLSALDSTLDGLSDRALVGWLLQDDDSLFDSILLSALDGELDG